MFSIKFGIFKFVNNEIKKRCKSNWVQPNGYDTSIKVYNCVVKDKVPFIVRNRDYVTWYTCGPTVYDSAHVGHASCYVKLDIVQRILRNYFNLNLVSVMNITDIDDKIIKKSTALTISPFELSKKYEKEFWDDLNLLNVRKPDIVLRVTEKMSTIKNFIQRLIDAGKAYVTSDGSVYFELKKYNNYGKLQNIGESQGTKSDKKFSGDFALWKGSKPEEPFWDSNWGHGRPGWHVECSAMAGEVFGKNIDVHAGGIDLRYPHHENEEAQSCSYFCTAQWVNYWMHTGYLHLVQEEKMSKSLKNTIVIRELGAKSQMEAFRMACLMSHYRSNMEYSSEVLQTAESNLKRIRSFVNECNSYVKGLMPVADIQEFELVENVAKSAKNIKEALQDDFNTAKSIKIIFDLIGSTNKMLHTSTQTLESNTTNCGSIIIVSNFVKEQFQHFGIDLDEQSSKLDSSDRLNNVVDILTLFRQNVRNLAIQSKNKNLLQCCDEVREELKLNGINIQDFGKLSSWNK